MRVFSFGGGVQSTAVLVLAAQGKVQYDAFVFANVGDDSENPATIAYMQDVALPFADKHGILMEEVAVIRRKQGRESLLQWQLRDERSIRLPVRLGNGAIARRSCTGEFKIMPIARWTKAHGATPENPATLGLGISMDEMLRMKTSRIPWQENEYPLIDRRMSRNDCLTLIREAGLPQPPKSSCWFCPFKSMNQWRDQRREQPDLFEKSVALEKTLNATRDRIGKDHVWLSGALRPLDQAVGHQAKMDFDQDDNCDGGYCGV